VPGRKSPRRARGSSAIAPLRACVSIDREHPADSSRESQGKARYRSSANPLAAVHQLDCVPRFFRDGRKCAPRAARFLVFAGRASRREHDVGADINRRCLPQCRRYIISPVKAARSSGRRRAAGCVFRGVWHWQTRFEFMSLRARSACPKLRRAKIRRYEP